MPRKKKTIIEQTPDEQTDITQHIGISDIQQNITTPVDELSESGNTADTIERATSVIIHEEAHKKFKTAPPLISARNIGFTYGTNTVLHNVSEEIYAHETYIIMGASGCGKSTFLKMIAGLTYPSEGEVTIHSVNLNTAKKHELINMHQRNSFIFQDSALIANMRIFDNVALPLRYHFPDLPESEIKIRVESVLDRVGLNRNDYLHLPAQLSLGERKLAAFARGLIIHPEILYCDEPLSSLDRRVAARVLSLIKDFKKSGGTSIIITHSLPMALDIGDRLTIFKAGQIIACASPKKVVKLKNPYIQEIIGI